MPRSIHRATTTYSTLLWSSPSPLPSSSVLAADLCPSPSFLAPLSPSFIRSIPLLSSSRSLSASVRRRSLCRRRGTRGHGRSHSSAASSLAGNERWRGSQRVERRRQHRGAPSPPSSSTSRVPMQSQPQETSSAYYILQQYTASGGQKLQNSIRNAYAMFGEMAMSHTKTKMEEAWTIEEVAFNVPGLSVDCFISPVDLRTGSVS
ncbi:hypothetical protein AHAS_Ahas16G0275800 [Arachis hypogaea]